MAHTNSYEKARVYRDSHNSNILGSRFSFGAVRFSLLTIWPHFFKENSKEDQNSLAEKMLNLEMGSKKHQTQISVIINNYLQPCM